ncbi:MAG TPA: hypothetical protein VGM86_29955 [Thermoanaerobaculia bacterium]
MKQIRFLLILPFLLSFANVEARAQCDPVNAISNCTVDELVGELGKRRRAQLAELKAMGEQKVAQASDNVVNTNRATPAPDPFAARLHASYQDFLVPWSFAINSVEESEDGRALIVRFNPFREPPFVGGLTVTASKPELDERVTAAIPEDSRDTEVKRLQDQINDLGDLTFSASVAAETVACTDDKKQCWGRNPKTYRNVLGQVALDLLPTELGSSKRADDAAKKIIDLARDIAPMINKEPAEVLNTKLSDIPSDQRQQIMDAAQGLVDADLADRDTYLKTLGDRGIEHLSALVDNQPQFSLTGSWRDRDKVAGPSEAAATLELQFGRHNLNSVKRGCSLGLSKCVADSLRAIQTGAQDITDKFVLSVSYKWTDRYELTADDVTVPGFTAINAPRIGELSAKLQWGQRLQQRVAGQQARFDINAEGFRMTENGVRTKNDWVGTATLTVPVASNMSIPISLKYGNRPDLVTDVRRHWGAHLGISYRLPWELKGQ